MGPWDALNQGFMGTFGAGMQQRMQNTDRKKNMEEEYAQRMKLLQQQSQLNDQELTPEMKLMRMYQGNPQAFSQFRQAMDPMAGQEMALKQAQLGLQQQQLQQNSTNQNYQNQMDSWKARYGQWKDQYGDRTNKQRDFQFLMQMPGMTQEKALQYLYRPDLMTQMMMMGGGGQMGMPGMGMPQGGGGLNYGQ